VNSTVTILIVVVVLLVIALAAVGAMLAKRRRSEHLQEHYGPEYERTVAERGDRRAAEAALTEREKRHRSLDIRELEPAERESFENSWVDVQRGFVDDPVQSVRRADALVVVAGARRGLRGRVTETGLARLRGLVAVRVARGGIGVDLVAVAARFVAVECVELAGVAARVVLVASEKLVDGLAEAAAAALVVLVLGGHRVRSSVVVAVVFWWDSPCSRASISAR